MVLFSPVDRKRIASRTALYSHIDQESKENRAIWIEDEAGSVSRRSPREIRMACRSPYAGSRIERRRKRSVLLTRPSKTSGRRNLWFLYLMSKSLIQHDDRTESLRADETLSR